MSTGPVLVSYIHRLEDGKRPGEVPRALPRYVPPQRLTTQPRPSGVVRSEAVAPNSIPKLNAFGQKNVLLTTIDARTPSATSPEFRTPTAFENERVLPHPRYQGAAVFLEPRDPRTRQEPRPSVYDARLNELRRQQQLVNNGDTFTVPKLPQSANPTLRITTPKLGRPFASNQDQALQTFVPFVKDPTTVQTRGQSKVWQNTITKVDNRMFEGIQSYRDERLEKRKRLQQAYRDRQQKEKAKVKTLLSGVVRQKQVERAQGPF